MEGFELGPWLGLLGRGLWVTVYATILGTILAVLVAFALGLLSLQHHAVPRTAARIIVEFFRGTSLVVQLFWIVYAMPILLGYKLDNQVAAILALGLNFGAYGAEVVRGAIKAVPKPQREACTALNLTALHRFRRVILPQALRLAIPPWSNEASIVLKDSSLVYALGVPEILRRAQQLSATTQQPFLAYGTAALIYFVLVFATNRALDAVSERTKLPTHP